MKCKYNDCGWCYYRGDESNDINGQCLSPQECLIPLSLIPTSNESFDEMLDMINNPTEDDKEALKELLEHKKRWERL